MPRLLAIALPVSLAAAGLFAISFAQEVAPSSSGETASEANRFVIVPLVTLQSGETKELMLSTWCTVGVTRSSGFGLTEMRDGTPVGGGQDVKTYRRGGLTITAPSFQEGAAFASSPKFSALKAGNIDAFKITIAASSEAKPGLLEMHLVDSTCAGRCRTDFRVLVVER